MQELMTGKGPLPIRSGIDHLVVTAASLEAGMDHVEAILGMRPMPGGRHPSWGTHNALLSLGESTYLEVIAPDPETSEPACGRLFQKCYLESPRLSAWAFRTNRINVVVAEAAAAGFVLGAVQPGSRETLDGEVLKWRLTDPYSVPSNGTVPFLIDWGETAHPARTLPRAGRLVSFRIEQSEPERLRRLLRVLKGDVEVTLSARTRLVAKIDTRIGIRVLS